jgi:hypothetical protein
LSSALKGRNSRTMVTRIAAARAMLKNIILRLVCPVIMCA